MITITVDLGHVKESSKAGADHYLMAGHMHAAGFEVPTLMFVPPAASSTSHKKC